MQTSLGFVYLQLYALGVAGKGNESDVYVAVAEADDVIWVTTRHYRPSDVMVMRVLEAVIMESLIHMQRTAGLVTPSLDATRKIQRLSRTIEAPAIVFVTSLQIGTL